MDNKSPVYWVGNNGIMSDCIFLKNGGVNGGAVTWMGNNGCINRVILTLSKTLLIWNFLMKISCEFLILSKNS